MIEKSWIDTRMGMSTSTRHGVTMKMDLESLRKIWIALKAMHALTKSGPKL